MSEIVGLFSINGSSINQERRRFTEVKPDILFLSQQILVQQ